LVYFKISLVSPSFSEFPQSPKGFTGSYLNNVEKLILLLLMKTNGGFLISNEKNQEKLLVKFFITVDEFRKKLMELRRSTRRGDIITIGRIRMPLEKMDFSQKFEILSYITELKLVAEEIGFRVMKEGVGDNGLLFLGLYRSSSVHPERRSGY